MGGYDLFKIKAVRGSAGWDKPQNLGYPINTEKDEIGLMVTMDGMQAYFATNKINAAQGWDIYYFDLYEAVRPEEVVLVKGQLNVADFVTDDEPRVVLKNSKTGEVTALNVSEDDRSFTAVVKKEEANDVLLKVEAKKASFSAAPLRLSPGTSNSVAKVEVELLHDELAAGATYPIPHILFETASDRLDAQSELLIAEFSEFLSASPSLRVEIQGHTDNVGDASANLDLSQRRAKRVAQTITSYGIDASRITSRGYGESKPVASNENEEGRAKNRRTVFVVKSL
jgi:outer membrane protein OmpA-like peptidoglycan-associated protein